MTTIVTRAGKGSSLSWAEMDANLNNLNDDKLEAGFPASDVANTPAGNITSTDVQAAINELDGEITLAATELSTLVVKKTSSTGAAIVPTGTTGQRPGSPVEGHLRRNSELGQWEGYDGSNWTGIGGVISVNGQTGAVTLSKSDVGLSNVDNTADVNKSVNYANSAGNADTVDNKHASEFAGANTNWGWDLVWTGSGRPGIVTVYANYGSGIYYYRYGDNTIGGPLPVSQDYTTLSVQDVVALYKLRKLA